MIQNRVHGIHVTRSTCTVNNQNCIIYLVLCCIMLLVSCTLVYLRDMLLPITDDLEVFPLMRSRKHTCLWTSTLKVNGYDQYS